MELARIVQDLSTGHFTRKSAHETESEIIGQDPKLYAIKPTIHLDHDNIAELQKFVRDNYTETKISVTLLNNFFECPWKWYFRNFLRLPEPKSVSLALGSAVHSTIEYILKASKLPNQKEIDEKIHDELRREGVHDEQEIKRLSKSAKVAVANWVDGFYQHLAKDYSSERSLSFRDPQFPNLTMYGKIDLTERFPSSTSLGTGGEVIVTDFKTGSNKTTGMIEKIDESSRLSGLMRQLAMYSYLMRGGERGTVVTTSRLLFLESDPDDKNALYSTHINNEQIDLLIRDITDYQNLLESGEWMKQQCHAKLYGSESECEYCKRAERIFGK